MGHLSGWEVSRLKRSMIPEVKEWHPYVGLNKVSRHRWGGMRLWPKWKSLRKMWSEGYKENCPTEEESTSQMNMMMEEDWKKLDE